MEHLSYSFCATLLFCYHVSFRVFSTDVCRGWTTSKCPAQGMLNSPIMLILQMIINIQTVYRVSSGHLCCSFIPTGLLAQIIQLFISIGFISYPGLSLVVEVTNFYWLDRSHPITRTQGCLQGMEARNFSFFFFSGTCSCPQVLTGSLMKKGFAALPLF